MLLAWLVALSLLAAEAEGAPPAARAPETACPVGLDRSCVLSLHGDRAPEIPASCLSAPWSTYLRFEQPGRLSNANRDAWWETVLRLTLDPANGCGCAVFVVTFGDRPEGLTVNLGDSPTNDGWGGDAGSTSHAAEVQIDKRTLSVFSDVSGTKVDMLLSLRIPQLPGRRLTFKICDQALSFELEKRAPEEDALVGVLTSMAFQHLFSLSGPSSAASPEGSTVGDYDFYAAFNRSIHVRGGTPTKGRVGEGLERAEIYLTP